MKKLIEVKRKYPEDYEKILDVFVVKYSYLNKISIALKKAFWAQADN